MKKNEIKEWTHKTEHHSASEVQNSYMQQNKRQAKNTNVQRFWIFFRHWLLIATILHKHRAGSASKQTKSLGSLGAGK